MDGQTQGASGAAGRWWRSPHWRKAPFVLLHHRSALAAVAVAGFLVALAASSAPLVTTAAASAARKDQLVDLSPLATGLEITGFARTDLRPAEVASRADTGERAIETLTGRLHLEQPIFTYESGTPLTVSAPLGDLQVLLMARTGVLAHVKLLSHVTGPGVWVADATARVAHVQPGGKLKLKLLEPGGAGRTAVVRVKGLYRALDSTEPGPYWAHYLHEIFPGGVDPPPPARYVFMSRAELFQLTSRLSSQRTIRFRGRLFHPEGGPVLTTAAELAVDPNGMTLARARSLAGRFASLHRQLPASALGRALGCVVPARLASQVGGRRSPCTVLSSLSSAVGIANRNASEISPEVTLLSGAAVAIALAVAGAAGVFLVRRRSAEAALLYARGERSSVFATRTTLELFLPIAVGAAFGFALALGLTGSFAPSGSVDVGTVGAAARDAALAGLAALALAVAAAAIVFSRLFGSRDLASHRLRWIPWELVLLVIAGWLLHEVLSGNGLARSTAQATGHPTLAVFVFPLLLVAAFAGIAARLLRPALRPRPGRGGSLPPAPFLALRRLSAAHGLLTALLVVSAVAFGAYFYAQALASSLTANVTEKGYAAYGGDVQGLVSDTTPLPKRFQYPLTKVDFVNQGTALGGPGGTSADVMAVDSKTLGAVIRWYPDWGRDPRPVLGSLAEPSARALPVIVTDDVGPRTAALWLQGSRIPIRIVARVKAFPGMSAGVPLIVADRGALAAAATRGRVFDPFGDVQTYVWAKGPPDAATRALEAKPVEAAYLTSIDAFRKNPEVVLATRTFSYMRLIAAASGVLVFVGLLLYLQARQRSQAVASALAGRMGLRPRDEVLSLILELAAITLLAAVIGGGVAVTAASPIVSHLDPVPDYPPGPVLAVPVAAIGLSLIGLAAIAVTAGCFTSWAARRTDMGEALRVA